LFLLVVLKLGPNKGPHALGTWNSSLAKAIGCTNYWSSSECLRTIQRSSP
jgi:hypothetical protein